MTLAAAEASPKAAEEGAEEVAQVDVPHVIAAITAGPGAEVRVDSGMAELVVTAALLLIGEDLIGLVDLLELGLGGLVSGVEVGVVLLGQAAVSLFQLVIGGSLGNA